MDVPESAYQSAIILANAGLKEDAFTMLRKLYEFLFKLQAIHKDSKNIEQIRIDRERKFDKLNEKIHNKEKGTEEFIKKNMSFDAVNIVGDSITAKEWAKRAEMIDIFNCEYYILSEYSHAGYDAINSSKGGDVSSIYLSFSRNYDSYKLIVTTAIDILLDAFDIMIEDGYISTITKEELENIKNKLKRINSKE